MQSVLQELLIHTLITAAIMQCASLTSRNNLVFDWGTDLPASVFWDDLSTRELQPSHAFMFLEDIQALVSGLTPLLRELLLCEA